MGCTKCRQEKIIEENKKLELVNPYTKDKRITFKSTSILDKLNNQIEHNDNIYTQKEILNEEEIKQLDEMTKLFKKNKRLIFLLKRCQSRILGMQLRKKIRFDNLRRSETMSLDKLIEKDLPLKKFQIENFFSDNPPLLTNQNIQIIKSDPIIMENKVIYIGEWDTNFFQRYGRGIQIYPDGSYYKGYWENNKAEGKGEFIHSKGDKYIGNWHVNKRHGKGIYKSVNGMEYEGYWKNDKQHGQGKEIWDNGNIYIGSYSNGNKNGNGRLQMKNGCIYEGNFTDGKMNGSGVFTFPDKRVYEGEFVNNKFEGKGNYTWPNGNKYKGYFKNDKREGFGIFYFNDGRKYRGVWSEGKLEGEYDLYYPIRGIWVKKKMKEEKKEIKSNTNKEKREEEENDNDIFNQGHIFDDLDLANIGEIKKSEDNKIELIEEDEF